MIQATVAPLSTLKMHYVMFAVIICIFFFSVSQLRGLELGSSLRILMFSGWVGKWVGGC